jgi:Na+/phosphate symporter
MIICFGFIMEIHILLPEVNYWALYGQLLIFFGCMFVGLWLLEKSDK